MSSFKAIHLQRHISVLKKIFECSICLDTMRTPMKTPCNHSFCRLCIEMSFGTKVKIPCPLCKEEITKRSLKELPNAIMQGNEQIIEAYQRDSGILYSPPRVSHSVVDKMLMCSQSMQSSGTHGTPKLKAKINKLKPRKTRDKHGTAQAINLQDDDNSIRNKEHIVGDENMKSPFPIRRIKRRKKKLGESENEAWLVPRSNESDEEDQVDRNKGTLKAQKNGAMLSTEDVIVEDQAKQIQNSAMNNLNKSLQDERDVIPPSITVDVPEMLSPVHADPQSIPRAMSDSSVIPPSIPLVVPDSIMLPGGHAKQTTDQVTSNSIDIKSKLRIQERDAECPENLLQLSHGSQSINQSNNIMMQCGDQSGVNLDQDNIQTMQTSAEAENGLLDRADIESSGKNVPSQVSMDICRVGERVLNESRPTCNSSVCDEGQSCVLFTDTKASVDSELVTQNSPLSPDNDEFAGKTRHSDKDKRAKKTREIESPAEQNDDSRKMNASSTSNKKKTIRGKAARRILKQLQENQTEENPCSSRKSLEELNASQEPSLPDLSRCKRSSPPVMKSKENEKQSSKPQRRGKSKNMRSQEPEVTSQTIQRENVEIIHDTEMELAGDIRNVNDKRNEPSQSLLKQSKDQNSCKLSKSSEINPLKITPTPNVSSRLKLDSDIFTVDEEEGISFDDDEARQSIPGDIEMYYMSDFNTRSSSHLIGTTQKAEIGEENRLNESGDEDNLGEEGEKSLGLHFNATQSGSCSEPSEPLNTQKKEELINEMTRMKDQIAWYEAQLNQQSSTLPDLINDSDEEAVIENSQHHTASPKAMSNYQGKGLPEGDSTSQENPAEHNKEESSPKKECSLIQNPGNSLSNIVHDPAEKRDAGKYLRKKPAKRKTFELDHYNPHDIEQAVVEESKVLPEHCSESPPPKSARISLEFGSPQSKQQVVSSDHTKEEEDDDVIAASPVQLTSSSATTVIPDSPLQVQNARRSSITKKYSPVCNLSGPVSKRGIVGASRSSASSVSSKHISTASGQPDTSKRKRTRQVKRGSPAVITLDNSSPALSTIILDSCSSATYRVSHPGKSSPTINRTPESINRFPNDSATSDSTYKSTPSDFLQKPGWIFVTSGIKKDHLKKQVEDFVRLVGAQLSASYTDATTHVLIGQDMSQDDPLVGLRTLKYFQGIAGKKWVISPEWVTACLRSKQFIPEEDYEIIGDLAFGIHNGPQRSRMAQDSLMSNVEAFFYGNFHQVATEDLQAIFEKVGGTVIYDPVDFMENEGKRKIILIETDDKIQSDIRDLKNFHLLYGVLIIGKDWLLDSIGTYKLHRYVEYVVNLTI